MALRKPLVLVDGLIQNLQAADILDANVSEVNLIGAINEETGAITLGKVVYVSSAGKVKMAQANAIATAKAIAMAYQASLASGDPGFFQVSGQIEMADWTAVAGAATLTAGTYYYLDPSTPGMITSTAPVTAGQLVTAIGIALTTLNLDISIQKPILL